MTETPTEISTEIKESLKLFELGELVGEVTILDDDHLVIKNDEHCSIYDRALNLLKDLDNISLNKELLKLIQINLLKKFKL